MKQAAPLELGISCRDVSVMRAFYEGVLGCIETQSATVPRRVAQQLVLAEHKIDFLWLQTPGGERIKLYATTHPSDAPAVPDPYLSDQAGIAYLTFYCGDLDATLQKARTAGARVLSDPAMLAAGLDTRIVFFTDPEGNVIELVEPKDISKYRSD